MRGPLRASQGEAERAHAPFAGLADGLDVGAGDPQRRMRLLERLGNDVARREVVVLAVELPALAREHRDDRLDRLLPALAPVPHAAVEGMQLPPPPRLAHA